MLTAACGGDVSSTSVEDPMRGLPSTVARRYVGCVGPTAAPDTFVLSVAEGRDFTADTPAGTPVPEKSELPQGVTAPIPPVTVTSGSPGGGPTPTTKIVTYTIFEKSGVELRSRVGHTVEVVGEPTREPEGQRPGMLDISSVRDLADHCK
jgi:hypothetical protein